MPFFSPQHNLLFLISTPLVIESLQSPWLLHFAGFSFRSLSAFSSLHPCGKPLVNPMHSFFLQPKIFPHPFPSVLLKIKQRTPLVPVKLTVDSSGSWPWVDCERNYVSSTYKLPPCDSPQCSLLWTIICGGDRCSSVPENTIASNQTFGDLSKDVISIQSTNGFNPGKMVTTPKFAFLCGSKTLVEGLPRGVTGMLL